jgi:glycosyltransferase involved in cell wall biosynthesis
MRIALCADGRSPHTQRWANALADRGHDAVIVWRRDQFEDRGTEGYRDSIEHLAAGVQPALRRPVAEWRERRAAQRLARRVRPELAHGLYLAYHGWTAHDLGVRPLVLTALGSDAVALAEARIGQGKHGLLDRYVLSRTRAAVRASDVVFCDSDGIARKVTAAVPGTETRLIRIGVELAPTAAACREAWRARLDVHGRFVLLSTRQLRPHYNIDVIIRALPAVLEAVPDAVLVLKEYEPLTEPGYREACLDLARRLGVEGSLRVVGELPRAELLGLHAAADLYVSVPDTDGTAVSVLEAMAATVPVVATDAPGLDAEIMRAGETVELVPIGDGLALADAIVDLARNADRRRRLAAAGRRVVERLGDFNAEVDKALQIYEGLLRRRPSSMSNASDSQ